MFNQEIEVLCSDCGSKEFDHPANPKSDDMIICKGCGRSYKYEVFEKMVVLNLEANIKKEFGNVF